MSQKLMVVVRYDLYPHMLVYDVASLEPRGQVRVHDIGIYRKEAVLAVVPKAEGMAIQAKLREIRDMVDETCAKVSAAGKAALYKEFPAIRRK